MSFACRILPELTDVRMIALTKNGDLSQRPLRVRSRPKDVVNSLDRDSTGLLFPFQKRLLSRRSIDCQVDSAVGTLPPLLPNDIARVDLMRNCRVPIRFVFFHLQRITVDDGKSTSIFLPGIAYTQRMTLHLSMK